MHKLEELMRMAREARMERTESILWDVIAAVINKYGIKGKLILLTEEVENAAKGRLMSIESKDGYVALAFESDNDGHDKCEHCGE